jgi:general secretion pathway protein D
MNRLALVFLAFTLCSTASKTSANALLDEEVRPAVAPVAASTAPEDAGVPINMLIRTVAKKTGKKFIIDPRVHGNVQLIGEEVANVTYNDLLVILQVEGFTAVEGGGFLRVIPEAIVRQCAMPVAAGSSTYPDAQYVTAVIPVRKVPAGSLVPILRPILPQYAHLAAAPCSNVLLVVDTFANIRRIESIVAALDTGDSYKVGCDNAPRATAGGPKTD